MKRMLNILHDHQDNKEIIRMKYLHIMPMDNYFNNGIIRMINENPLDFNMEDHFFIMMGLSKYKELQHYSNVKYEPEILKMQYKKFLKYANYSDNIFLHSLPLSLTQMMLLKKNIANKIVWCVWGHDLYGKKPKLINGLSIYRKLRRLAYRFLINLIYVNRVKQFHAIGIGFKYDALEIRRLFDDIQIVMAPYGLGYPKLDVDKAVAEFKNNEKVKNRSLKIMIGHSSYSFLKHEEILNKLLKYKEENITISLPLSYGDKEYAKHVESIATQLFEDKVEIIKGYMILTDYVKFLMSIDIAIFDYDHQSALGNIILLLYLGKKVYLSNKGIIHWAMRAEGIKIYNARDIGSVPFDVLEAEHVLDERAVMYSGYYLDEKNIIDLWKTTIKELQ